MQIVEEENSRNYRRRIQSFINYTDVPKREELVVAFARRDREKLLQLTIPYLKESPQFAALAWVAPGGHIFLRVHNPSLFGNDTSKKRPDIVDANREQHQHAAYKVSEPGLLYNVVQPVSYKIEHLGILQFWQNHSSFQVYKVLLKSYYCKGAIKEFRCTLGLFVNK